MFLHIDLDCFFVSAARIKEPGLEGKLVAVASGNTTDIFGNHLRAGIILSASYEARTLGIKTTMPVSTAQKIAPELIIRGTDFTFYKELSVSLKKLLYSYTNEIEQFSIDEFFVDLTGTRQNTKPLEFARLLKNQIWNELHLPCSVGLARTKFMSKFATHLAKPNGVRLINDLDEIAKLKIEDFPGIGKSSSKQLAQRGIIKFEDLNNKKLASETFSNLGKYGRDMLDRLTMSDNEKISVQKERKSLAMARTFDAVSEREIVKKRILTLCRHVSLSLYKKNLTPHRYELKFKYKGVATKSVSTTLYESFSQKILEQTMLALFATHDENKTLAITYLSVGVSAFREQHTLFETQNEKISKLDDALSKIRVKYGVNAIKNAQEL